MRFAHTLHINLNKMTAKSAAEELATISKKTATEQLTLQHMIELREAFEIADREGKGALSPDAVSLMEDSQ